MKYDAWFQCVQGCERRHELNEIIYRCTKCGNLLEVKHDVDRLKTRSAAAWMSLFEKRYMRTAYPYGSGVWGKKELICPNIDNWLVKKFIFKSKTFFSFKSPKLIFNMRKIFLISGKHKKRSGKWIKWKTRFFARKKT